MQPDHPHADYIRALVDEAPELTETQRAKLAAILRPGASGPAPARAPRGEESEAA
jgi:hypothetical protein